MQRAGALTGRPSQASQETGGLAGKASLGRVAGLGTPPGRAWCTAHGPGAATAGQTGRSARVATGLHRRSQEKGHASDEYLPTSVWCFSLLAHITTRILIYDKKKSIPNI